MPAYDVSTECCDPLSGSIAMVDDGDPCTRDECDPATGGINHPPATGGIPCDDGEICTLDDVCNGAGECTGTDADAMPCTTDADCFGLPCLTDVGRCHCNTTPELSLIAVRDGDCHAFGDELIVDVVLGNSTATIVGGQFLIEYDPAVLDFVFIEPGAAADPTSPFGLQLASDAD